jgi:hypothetical protein
MAKPLCFVMMPFHATHDSEGQRIDFDAVYHHIIRPAVEDAEMEPLRADEERRGGVFHKTMFERLVVCEFAIADLSTGNPNVFYELGVRHGVRPYSTVLVFRNGWHLPLDVVLDTAIGYSVTESGQPVDTDQVRHRLVEHLTEARQAATDSPVFQLVAGLPVLEVDHSRIDTFREHRDSDEQLRRRLDKAARSGPSNVAAVEAGLGAPDTLSADTVLGLAMAYRSLGAWTDMARVLQGASRPIQSLALVRQQLGFALNRAGEDKEAEKVLEALLSERESTETFGLLGRVYKDRWRSSPSPIRARGYLRKAIDVYLRGFELDWRDPYPGVNALILMSLETPADERLGAVLPVVRYANDRRLRRSPDYWDYATDLMLAVLERDWSRADRALANALAVVRDSFEPETTRDDLLHVRDAAARRGEHVDVLKALIHELDADIALRHLAQ